MNADFSKIAESKRRMRRELAALPFAEKLRIIEKMRDAQVPKLGKLESSAQEQEAARPKEENLTTLVEGIVPT